MIDAAALADARAFHTEVPVVDLHTDTPKLMEVAGFDVSVRHSPLHGGGAVIGHFDLPRVRDGGLGVQLFGMWTFPKPERGCTASVHRQLDAVAKALRRHDDQMTFCRTGAEARAAHRAGKLAVMASIEGGQALEGDVGRVAEFARRGVRSLGLLHFSSSALGRPAFGWGRKDSEGLTKLGRAVVEACDANGVLVDLAHVNRKGFFDALEAGTRPPVVTHTGVSGVQDHWRNIDDEQIRAVAARGGVLGVIFARTYLGPGGVERVCEHLEHIVKIAGEDAAAIGSDFDGFVRPPPGLEDVSALPRLTLELRRRGMSDAVLAKLLGGNALRVFDDLPVVHADASPLAPEPAS